MNLRKLRVWLLLVTLTPLAAAQFTLVSGTVTDPSGLPYANGTITPTLISSGSPTLSGVAYTPPTQPVGLSQVGGFAMQLADNTQLSPGGSQWQFLVCSAAGTVQPAGGSGPICFTTTALTISGSSQSITAQLTAAALSLLAPTGVSVPVVNTSGRGFFISAGLLSAQGYATNTAPVVGSANAVRVTQFVLPARITISKITIKPAAILASSTITVGIYSADGNTKLIDSGTFNGGSASVQTNTIVPVTLNPGVYNFAQSASSSSTLTVVCLANDANSIGSSLLNNNVVRTGNAANSATAGVLPSTLGTITSIAVNLVAAVFEP